MSIKHTPSPWNQHPSMDSKEILHCPAVDGIPGFSYRHFTVAKENKIIGVIQFTRHDDTEITYGHPSVENADEAESNFRLVCAAPELLDALKDAETELGLFDALLMEKLMKVGIKDEEFEEVESAMLHLSRKRNLVAAAISKAEGRA